MGARRFIVHLADSYEPREMSEEERSWYHDRGMAVCEVGSEMVCDDMESLGRSILIVGGIPSRGAFGSDLDVVVPVLYMSTTKDYWARMMLVEYKRAPTGNVREWFSEN